MSSTSAEEQGFDLGCKPASVRPPSCSFRPVFWLSLALAHLLVSGKRCLDSLLTPTPRWPAEMALECASAYYRYGCALFYKAQQDNDVLGAPLRQAADEREAAAEGKGLAGAGGTALGLWPMACSDGRAAHQSAGKRGSCLSGDTAVQSSAMWRGSTVASTWGVGTGCAWRRCRQGEH